MRIRRLETFIYYIVIFPRMNLGEAVEEVLGRELEAKVKDYCICIRYTYVELENGGFGVYHTPIEDYEVPKFRKLSGKRAIELFRLRNEKNMLLRALAWAAANAASSARVNGLDGLYYDASPAELAGVRSGDRVLMIGNMKALKEELLSIGAVTVVLERKYELRHDALPDTFIEELEMDFDFVFVTGSAIAVPTFERLLERISKIPKKAITGPFSSLFPTLLHEIGFDVVSGVSVEDVESIKEFLRQGNFLQGHPGALKTRGLSNAVKVWTSVRAL